MFVKIVRIHFVNGEVLPIGECVEEDEECKLVERYRKALPDGVLHVEELDNSELIIPVANILYISVELDDEI